MEVWSQEAKQCLGGQSTEDLGQFLSHGDLYIHTTLVEIPLQDLHRAVLFDFLPPNPRSSPEMSRLWPCTPGCLSAVPVSSFSHPPRRGMLQPCSPWIPQLSRFAAGALCSHPTENSTWEATFVELHFRSSERC